MDVRINKILLKVIVISMSLLIYSCSSQKIVEKNTKLNSSNLLADTNKLEQEARYFYINGINYQIQYKDADAIIEFQEALRFDQKPSIYYSMAKSYYNLYKKERAIENLKISLDIDPNHLPSLDLISDIYYFSDIKSAISYNEKALEVERTKERLFKQAVLNENYDADKSIQLYNELLNEDSGNILILQKLSEIYIKDENNEKALEILYKLDKYDSGNSITFDQILLILFNQDKMNEAFTYIKSNRLNLSEIEYEKILYDFGLILYNKKDNTFELDNYLDYIYTECKFTADLMTLGAFISSKYKNTKLDLFIENAIKYSEPLSKGVTLALSIYNSMNDTSKAIELINKHSDIVKNNLDLLLAASFTYSQINEDSLSLEYLRKGLILDSNNADIYSQMGFIYDKLGMIEMSDSSYITALNIEPNHPNANNNYAYSLSTRDLKLKEALEMSKKVIDAKIQSSAYFDTYAWINYKLGNLDIALEYLLEAIKFPDASAEVFEHLGIVHMEKGDFESAKQSFIEALELDPKRKISRENLEKLKNK